MPATAWVDLWTGSRGTLPRPWRSPKSQRRRLVGAKAGERAEHTLVARGRGQGMGQRRAARKSLPQTRHLQTSLSAGGFLGRGTFSGSTGSVPSGADDVVTPSRADLSLRQPPWHDGCPGPQGSHLPATRGAFPGRGLSPASALAVGMSAPDLSLTTRLPGTAVPRGPGRGPVLPRVGPAGWGTEAAR